jgi:sugar phosphate isomerase/epimerase
MRMLTALLGTLVLGTSLGFAAPPGLPNPFYAMDTCTKRPYPKNDITPAQQFDMLKEMGYAGIAWTEAPADHVKKAAQGAEARGLKIFTIYCSATVTPAGELKASPLIEPIMEALQGHGTVIWLHIGGRGPRIENLSGSEPVIVRLAELAANADRHGLKIALYPHIGDWTEHFADALRVAHLVNHKNFGVTFNLCHTLAVGDEEKIPGLIEQAGPSLFAVTINGADAQVKGPKWDRLIQNLDRGSYDVGIVLRTLKRLGYVGPIGLQGYGIGGDRRVNLEHSMRGWRRLSGGDQDSVLRSP